MEPRKRRQTGGGIPRSAHRPPLCRTHGAETLELTRQRGGPKKAAPFSYSLFPFFP